MNKDELMELHFKDIKGPFTLSRREFIKVFGGGIIIFFTFKDSSAFQELSRAGAFLQISPSDSNAYLRIGEDGRVTCLTGKIEMGQGVTTSFAQMVAEELDVPLDSVDMLVGDTELSPCDIGTFGSMSIRFFGPLLREAAAQARAVLIELAAEKLKIPPENLITRDGVVFDKNNSKNHVSYGELAKGQSIGRRLDKKASVKKASEFTVIGKSHKRIDGPEKVTGKAVYAGDIRLPDMLYARIVRPPAHGAKMKSVDTSAVNKIKDALVVQDNDLVAVLHKSPDGAEKALAKVKAQFDSPESDLTHENIFKHLLNVAPKGRTISEKGDIEKGEKAASSIIEETYLNSYVAHATMEPHTAVARVEENKITVWTSTQTPFLVRTEVAQALGMPAKNVHIITPFVGGGFGGKSGQNSQAIEAARLAKLTGRPVQVAWSREEEFFYDAFRPAAVVKIKSGINEEARIPFWDFKVYFAGERGSEQLYDIPNHRVVSYGTGFSEVPGRGVPGSHPFETGPWRAPAANTNTFARESHNDILASKAGKDPLQFRIDNLSDKRMINVLRAGAEKFGWTPAKGPSGRGYGVACGFDADTYVATMAEVAVDKKTGQVQVKRVVCVQDMGLVINPEGARMQMEGCITMGMGYALTEEIHFKGGKIFDLNFDTYEIPRFSWLPKIETLLIESEDPQPHGGGEPAITCMGAVIANAIYDATGARLFQLPMTQERIKERLKET